MIPDLKELLEMKTRPVNRRKRVDRRALESVLRGDLGSGGCSNVEILQRGQYTLTCQLHLGVTRS